MYVRSSTKIWQITNNVHRKLLSLWKSAWQCILLKSYEALVWQIWKSLHHCNWSIIWYLNQIDKKFTHIYFYQSFNIIRTVKVNGIRQNQLNRKRSYIHLERINRAICSSSYDADWFRQLCDHGTAEARRSLKSKNSLDRLHVMIIKGYPQAR